MSRRLLLAATVACAAAFVASPATASPGQYSRPCGGILDAECRGLVCPMDCFVRDCLVWIDPLHNPMTALCIGPVVSAQS